MSLLLIGIIALIIFFTFRKVFRILFYIGLIIIIFIIMAAFSPVINSSGTLDEIHSGFQSVTNSSGIQELESYIIGEFSNFENSINNYCGLNIKKNFSDFLNNDLGLTNALHGIKKYNEKMTVNQYRNSKYYNEELFDSGDKYCYVNGILCEKQSDFTDNYNIYKANINGYNYIPININGEDNFNGFSIGNNSITIDGITYYKNLNYNKINFYGESYGISKEQLEDIKNNKVFYKKSDEEVYLNGTEYIKTNGVNGVTIDGEKYQSENNDINLEDFINIDGTIYWKSDKKNSSTIDINGVYYNNKKTGFLATIF